MAVSKLSQTKIQGENRTQKSVCTTNVNIIIAELKSEASIVLLESQHISISI